MSERSFYDQRIRPAHAFGDESESGVQQRAAIRSPLGMDAMGEIATVTVHIRKLREKIEQDPSNPQYIETIWGAGYRFRI